MATNLSGHGSIRFILACVLALAFFSPVPAESEELPDYLRDRGRGVPLSMFGTYIEKGQFIAYFFYEYYYDKDMEYDPSEFGFSPVEADYRGRYIAHEELIFMAYGATEDLAVEFEAAVIDARLEKADNDTTATPDEIHESGLGDVEGQIRWRFRREDESRPELFTYFETVAPTQKNKLLIGTPDWEFKLGAGATKGYGFGTMTLRLAVEYDKAENKLGSGEYAVEYVKRLSDRFRVYIGIEGEEDEVEFIPEIQWHISKTVVAKCNLGIGLTSKATDFAPEAGIMFIF